MAVELKVPESGESITEVQIGGWLKSEGDFVEQDEAIVEIETDKASMELSAPSSGLLARVLKRAGDAAEVGEVIAVIEESARPEGSGEPAAAEGPAAVARPEPTTAPPRPSRGPETPAESPAEPVVLPAARRELAEHDLAPGEVQGTGPGGRILKEDVLRHVALQREARAPEPAAPPAMRDGEDEVVPMSLLRRRVAERLVDAQQQAALLTTFNEIDMAAVKALRAERGEAFEKKHGVRLGFMSFFVKAAIDALKLVPQVNAEIRGTDIVYHNYYDIGVAVSTDRGLVVPVIREADRLSFAEVEEVIGDLSARAREKKIGPEELQGGTFTISNGGVFGSLLSTPIVNPPQSGILGLHAIQDRPVVRQGQIVVRPMMYVALTYDHRLIDGRESVTFLKRIKECIEDPARILLEV